MEYLAAWLQYKGITAYRLIQMTDMKPTYVYNYVHNKEPRPPSATAQRKIANALGISAEALKYAPPEG